MSDEPKLLPCPFCGGAADIYTPSFPMAADCDDIIVRCDSCDATGRPVLFDQDSHDADDLDSLTAEAIAAWNTRAAPAPVASGEVERLIAHAREWIEEGTSFLDGERYRTGWAVVIERLLSLTTPARAVSDWRPIADAPKDEVSKLGTDGVLTAVISWIPDNYFGDGNPARWHPITPTHWMPLPVPPSLALIGGE